MTNPIRWKGLLKKGKAMFLACDQGLEHGPTDFNEHSVDPKYILDIALEGGFTGVIFQHGIAEKYYEGAYKDVPLIVKLNGRSKLPKIDPISRQLCSVERAVKLGAAAVGYTIYDGSPMEPEMFREFGRIVEEAHNYGIPVIAWMYPRGKDIKNDLDNNLLAYSARIGLELGADMIKIKYNGDLGNFRWMLKCAGRAKVVISGGDKTSHQKFLTEAYETAVQADCAGIAVGRNIWQDAKPYALSKALEQVVFHKSKPDIAMQMLN